MNNRAVLIVGGAAMGKSTSLRNLKDRKNWVYLNTDKKDLPVKGEFKQNVVMAQATDILTFLPKIEAAESVDGIILDTVTFLMNMYERQFVRGATNGQSAWGDYGAFYGDFIDQIKSGTKPAIIMAHETTELNEQTMQYESKIPVKGAVGRMGVEADFTTVVTCKQIPIKKLKDIKNDYLTITEREKRLGVKYVFQTIPTKESIGDCTRSPFDMWEDNEVYIDNDVQHILDKLNKYYGY